MHTTNFAPVLFFASLVALSSSAMAQDRPDASSQPTSVDNTKINERDRANTLKPIDQPNNSRDIKIAADARRAIVDDKSLSTMAHNIKLVANGGVVTLRGPVNSTEEKTRVGQIVASVHGVSNVDNQLDVKNQ